MKIFCMRTLVFWSMVSMIKEFACQEGLIKKHCGLVCAFQAHRDASSSDLDLCASFDVVRIYGFDANDFRNFFVQKEPRERRRRFKSESQSVPSNSYKKDRK